FAAAVAEAGGPVGDPAGPWVDPASAGRPYGSAVEGLLTFRGNPTRTYHGAGPVPASPQVAWRFPAAGGLCSPSRDQHGLRTWCGTGWTGQPAVFPRGGRTWVVFGAYDRNVHFLDAETGTRLLPDFPTGDIIKGSVTVDPDGFPLVYTGSRDNKLRVLAIDRDRPTELWRLDARASRPTLWNDDWDASPLVLGDHLLVGGENSRFYVIRLNRSYGPDGAVRVAPEVVVDVPGWDAQLLADLGDKAVSIEGSVAVSGDVAYFANSGGLVQGWSLAGLAHGRPAERVFRFWTGDDTDASVVIDEAGALYVASEFERGNARSRQVGQFMKLDPSRPDNPLVWRIEDQATRPAGGWATPALHRDLALFVTHGGQVLAVDRASGARRWSLKLPGPTWQSPVVVDDTLVIGDCAGVLHGYELGDGASPPPERWRVQLEGCIESTPAVWRGSIYVGARGGAVYGLR
ncbi:MAG: PQQ-binding-like beta-propeller repeat protein, partial [Acidimicrobiales bacterium]